MLETHPRLVFLQKFFSGLVTDAEVKQQNRCSVLRVTGTQLTVSPRPLLALHSVPLAEAALGKMSCTQLTHLWPWHLKPLDLELLLRSQPWSLSLTPCIQQK